MFRLTWAVLKAGKVRYGMILMAVFFSAATIATVWLVSQTLEEGVARDRERAGPDVVIVPPGAASSDGRMDYVIPGETVFPSSQVQTGDPEMMKGIAAITPQLFVKELQVGNRRLKLVGFDAATDFIVTPWLRTGQPQGSRDPKQVILGVNANQALGQPGEMVTIEKRNFRNGGVLDETGTDMDNTVYLDLQAAREFRSLSRTDAVSWLLLRGENSGYLRELTADLNVRLQPLQAVGKGEFTGAVAASIGQLSQGTLFGLVTFFVVVATLLLTGSLFTIHVWERMREWGIMLSLGAAKADLIKLIALEGVLLALGGGALGLIAGILLAGHFSQVCQLPGLNLPMLTWVTGGTLALTGTLCLLMSLVPAWLVLRFEPALMLQKGYK